MKIKSIIGILCLCLCLLIAPAAAAGGSGTAASPYVIETVAELQSIQNDLTAYYVLANDINLEGVSFIPIGSTTTPFIGSFDGRGYTISNWTISSSTPSTGFFRCLGPGAVVKDITFQDCKISCTDMRTGTVFGVTLMSETNQDVARITNIDCVRCTVSGESYTGVIGGSIYTMSVVNMSNCNISFANVYNTAGNNVGAVIGHISAHGHLDITDVSVKKSKIKSVQHGTGVIASMYNTSSVYVNNIDVDNCIFESNNNNAAGVIAYMTDGAYATMNDVTVINCIMICSTNAGGLIGVVDGGYAVATNCNVTKSTLVVTSKYAGGVCARVITGSTGLFGGCTVSDCTILASSNAAGIISTYS